MRFRSAPVAAPFLAAFAVAALAASCGGGDSSTEPSGSGAGTTAETTSTSGSGEGGASTSSGPTTGTTGQGGSGGTSATTTAATTTSATTTTTTGSGGAGGQGNGGAGGFGCECPAPPECTEAHCEGPNCVLSSSAIGSPCAIGQCDGQGQCVECLVGADCPSLVCLNNTCAAPSCADLTQNGSETGVDCGGPNCPACPSGGGCQSAADCQSGVCMAGVCIAPACNDGVKNGSETGVDCGGGACPLCADGLGCLVSGDCASGSCQSGLCGPSGYACLGQAPDAVTGQGCPLLTPCAQFADCGVFQGCNQWFCNNAAQCELNTLSNCGTTVGGGCAAEVVFTQHDDPPTDKRFVPPDGVNFREMGTLTFTITNNTATDLYLDKIPMSLETLGGGSQFEVTSAKLYDDSGGTDFSIGDLFVCLTGSPFQFPANGVLGPCAGSSFTKVPKNGGSNRFLVTLAFGADKTFIAGRSYRAKIASTAGFAFKVGFNGAPFVGTMCGIPAGGYAGAWVTAQSP
jgi:hypothetical protein